METFNVEIQCQHLLRLLLFSFQTAALKHFSCHGSDRLWQTTISQSSSLCQWLKALLSAWRAAGWRLCDRPDFHTDQSPFAHSLASQWCHPPLPMHTHMHAHNPMHSTRLHFHSPLALPSAVYFIFTAQKTIPDILFTKQWTHTQTHLHYMQTQTSHVMLIWHHQGSVQGFSGQFIHAEPSLETMLLLPHTNTYYTYYYSLTRLCSDFWNKMVHLSLSSSLQLPDFWQTRFPLLSSSGRIYFSVWAAHIKACTHSVPSALCVRLSRRVGPSTHHHMRRCHA